MVREKVFVMSSVCVCGTFGSRSEVLNFFIPASGKHHKKFLKLATQNRDGSKRIGLVHMYLKFE